MRTPTIIYPDLQIQEDMMTAYEDDVVGGGPVWWDGSTIVYTGHMGIWNGVAVSSEPGWGPYEHLHPSDWLSHIGEGYRRCCTSIAWVGEVLAARLMNARAYWNHDAFFSYVDRWMDPTGDADYADFLYSISGGDMDYRADWAQHGQTYDTFVNEMWAAYR